MIGESIWEKFTWTVNTEYETAFRNAMKTRLSASFEIKSLIGDLWYEINVYPSSSGISVFWIEITERKRLEKERTITVEFLHLTNKSKGTADLIHSAVNYFREKSGFEAAGIRLKDGDDYPYYEISGFPNEFIKLENSLCSRDAFGQPIKDSDGYPIHECMCGNVINGRFDVSKPFFTKRGSFCTNCTTELLASTTEADRQARTRNRCNGEGYESVALIALRAGDECLGLLQLNDKRKGRFSPETIMLWERLADYLAIAIARTRAEESLRKAYENLQVQSEELQAQSEELQAQSEELQAQSEEIQVQNEELRNQTDELLKAYEALNESEKRYRLLFNHSLDAIILTDPEDDGKILSANPAACLMLGWSEEELIGKGRDFILDPDDPAIHILLVKRSQFGSAQDQLTYKRKDGTTFTGELSTALFKDINGEPRSVGIIRDITKRKLDEEALRKSEERYRAIFTNMTDAFFLSEVIQNESGEPDDYRFLEINPAYETHTGAKRELLLGKTFLEVYPDASPISLKVYREVALTGQSAHFEVFSLAVNNKYLDIYAFSPEKEKLAVIFRDVTESKKAEEAIWESRAKLEAAIESMPDAVFISDVEGNFVDINNAFATLHRLKSKEECYRTLSEYSEYIDVYFSDGTLAPLDMWAVPRALRGEKVTDAEYILRRKDSGETWIGSYSFSPIRDKDGMIIGSVVVCRDITERKLLEEQIRQRAEELEMVMEVAPVAIWIGHDPQSQIITGNRMANEFYEAEVGENVSASVTPARRFFHKGCELTADELPMQQASLKDIFVRNAEFDVLLPSGKWRALLGSASPLHDADGSVRGSVGTFIDITEHKKAEEAIRERESARKVTEAVESERQRLFDVLETLPVIICLLTPDHYVAFANRACRAKFGDTEGRYCYEYCYGYSGLCEFCKTYKVLETGLPQHWEINNPNGSIFDSYNFPFTDVDGSPMILVMDIDITERKKAEEKIRHLANIVESSNDSIITYSQEGFITSWNKGAEEIFAYSAQEVLGKPIYILEPSVLAGETKELSENIKQGNAVKHYETSRLKKDGIIINISLTLSQILDVSGKFVAFSCIARDITEKKMAEKLVHEKQMAEYANHTKSDFLAKISHELRTPLNSIIGFSDMLNEQAYGKLNEKQQRAIGNISKSGKHLLNLINSILDISKVEAGKMELNYKNFELATKLTLVRNFLSPIADRKNIKIEIDMDDNLKSICADEDKFMQIMYNLADNAIKFSYENSLVKIGARKKGDLIEIRVTDIGIGIKYEDQHKLFKPFSQIDSFSSRKTQGTGLGLFLVKQIVHLHRGYVWYKSKPSEGSIFAFAIPINKNNKNINEK